jgi:hypothetical protein
LTRSNPLHKARLALIASNTANASSLASFI